jgi:hypothetical protein
MANPLKDKEFLKRLHEYNIRTVYARIISLNEKEEPL